MTFNLLTEAWIPVLRMDGRAEQVGIKTALTEAGQIRQIAACNPMDRVAMLRFLLAVIYWCRGNPPLAEEKDRLGSTGGLPGKWFGRLEEHGDCFNLLGSGKRLFQDPNAKRKRAATDLLQEIPTGNNFWHFRHSTDGCAGLCAPCSALGLLRLPLFSVSGLPDLKAGINGTPPLYVVPVGRSLLHTLSLNWVHHTSIGAPSWEERFGNAQADKHIPLLSGLTMLSRRVWLHSPVQTDDPCIACGSTPGALVRTCEYQSAGVQQHDGWDDPHVVYRQKAQRDGTTRRIPLVATDLTKAHFRLDRPWVPLFAQLAADQRWDVDLLIVGFATDQAKNIDVWERACRMPARPAALNRESTAALLEVWQEECSKGVLNRMKLASKQSDSERIVATTAAVRPHVESVVSGTIPELLGGSDTAWQGAVDEFRRMTPAIAHSLAPGFTTRAVQRRNLIAQAAPNMSAKPAARARKPKVAKEAEQ